jgi:hypothetical protein
MNSFKKIRNKQKKKTLNKCINRTNDNRKTIKYITVIKRYSFSFKSNSRRNLRMTDYKRLFDNYDFGEAIYEMYESMDTADPRYSMGHTLSHTIEILECINFY